MTLQATKVWKYQFQDVKQYPLLGVNKKGISAKGRWSRNNPNQEFW